MIATASYGSADIYRSSGLFGRVVRDATVYFLVIVWMHLTVTIYTSRMGDVSTPLPCSGTDFNGRFSSQQRILRLFPTM